MMEKQKIYPAEFPEPWASDWGEDEYGLWMAFTYKGIRQDFRWLEPGTFQMGSPEDEAGRDDDETPHQVTLSQGFWLADSTVTQALWQAVMGENPSDFKGDNKPVDGVSWDDAQKFIDKMNGMKAQLKLCLPSEAQWEYACRAGTTTPFSFGEQIDSSRVNFDGNHPYNDGQKSEYRQQTLAVKSLPANHWGLYEMHGNLYEWCKDWHGDYPQGSVTDPQASSTDDSRMLRGGSGFSSGRSVRSAARIYRSPGNRYRYIGFRLARGH